MAPFNLNQHRAVFRRTAPGDSAPRIADRPRAPQRAPHPPTSFEIVFDVEERAYGAH